MSLVTDTIYAAHVILYNSSPVMSMADDWLLLEFSLNEFHDIFLVIWHKINDEL